MPVSPSQLSNQFISQTMPYSVETHRNSPMKKYHLHQKVGQGSYSTVHSAFITSNPLKRVAIKSIKKPKNAREDEEISMLKWIKWLKKAPNSKDHPGSQHVVDLLDTFSENSQRVIVMELLEGGTVFELCENLGALTEDEAFWIFEQMCLAISFLHSNNICHRDLKLENWMLDSSKTRIVLVDFGFSTFSKPDTKLTQRCGSFNYIAPEIVRGVPYNGKKVDMWALGCILYSLLAGFPAFYYDEEKGDTSVFEEIESGDYEELPDHISISAHDLVSKLLSVDPQERLTIDDVLDHPWMRGY